MIPDYLYDFLAQGDWIGLPAQISVIPGSDYVLVQPSKHFLANKKTNYKFNMETQIWEPSRCHQPVARRRNNPHQVTVSQYTTEQTDQSGAMHTYEVPVNTVANGNVGYNPNLIYHQEAYRPNLEQFNQLDINQTGFSQQQTMTVESARANLVAEHPCGDRTSAENKEHTNKAGQFQQHISGNDEDFGPLDCLDRTYLRRTMNQQNSRSDATDFILSDNSTANTQMEDLSNSATTSTPNVSVYGAVQEDNVNWPVTPTAGDEYQSNISNKEKCFTSADVFIESPKPGPSGLSNTFRSYPVVEHIYQNSSEDD